jgi:hypothetical protein
MDRSSKAVVALARSPMPLVLAGHEAHFGVVYVELARQCAYRPALSVMKLQDLRLTLREIITAAICSDANAALGGSAESVFAIPTASSWASLNSGT